MAFLGIVHEVSRRIFHTEVEMAIEKRMKEHIYSLVREHIVFTVVEVRLFHLMQYSLLWNWF